MSESVSVRIRRIFTGTLTDTHGFLGDHGEGETPVPIPNTAVKPFSADGTAWVTVWESRTSPRLKFLLARAGIKSPSMRWAFLFLGFILNLLVLFGKEAKEGTDIGP